LKCPALSDEVIAMPFSTPLSRDNAEKLVLLFPNQPHSDLRGVCGPSGGQPNVGDLVIWANREAIPFI
jgi:hypothetical protein